VADRIEAPLRGFTTEGQTMSDNISKKPTHRIYAVTKQGAKPFWQKIGAAWAHQDGEGFSLKLEYLPLNGAEIVIRKPKDSVEETAPVTA
jgi:hypothetical protein